MEEHDGDEALIGEYAVLIVPPGGDEGAWLVTLGQWDASQDSYVAFTDGPLLESREEALAEAGRVMDWLDEQAGAENLLRVWHQMQEQRGAEVVLDENFLQARNPWSI